MDEFESDFAENLKHNRRKLTISSLDSLPELKRSKEFYLRFLILIIDILSTIIGIYLIINYSYYYSSEYDFFHLNLLRIFAILYTAGMIGAFLLSFLLSLTIRFYFFIKKNKKNYITIFDGQRNSITTAQIENANNIAVLPYTLTIFIILTIILYLCAVPFGSFLLITMFNNNIYYYKSRFILLYIFILLNIFVGLLLLTVLLIQCCAKRKELLRQKHVELDEESIETIKNEVKLALANAKK